MRGPSGGGVDDEEPADLVVDRWARLGDLCARLQPLSSGDPRSIRSWFVSRHAPFGPAGGACRSCAHSGSIALVPYLGTHLSFSEITDHLYVSRSTPPKSQAISITASWGVSSRSQAINPDVRSRTRRAQSGSSPTPRRRATATASRKTVTVSADQTLSDIHRVRRPHPNREHRRSSCDGSVRCSPRDQETRRQEVPMAWDVERLMISPPSRLG